MLLSWSKTIANNRIQSSQLKSRGSEECWLFTSLKMKSTLIASGPTAAFVSPRKHPLGQTGGGRRGGCDEFWDRRTMFSQLAKRSIRGLSSWMFSRDFNFGFER